MKYRMWAVVVLLSVLSFLCSGAEKTIAVTVNTNGVLRGNPSTNFFVANSNLLNSAVARGGGATTNANYLMWGGTNAGLSSGKVLTGASGITLVTNGNLLEISAQSTNGGTVTSISVTSATLTVTGSPITSSGAIGVEAGAAFVLTNQLYSLSTSNYLSMYTNGANLLVGADTNTVADKAWVRSLFNYGYFYYASTNSDTNGFDTNSFYFVSSILAYGSRVYSGVTNGQYIGTQITTNRFTSLQGPITVNSYLSYNTGGGRTVSLHPEIYYTYDKTNLLGDWESANQTLVAASTTNLYQFTLAFPTITSTNATGFYVVRRYKIGTQSGNPNVTFHLGTNFNSFISIEASGADAVAGVYQPASANLTNTANGVVANTVLNPTSGTNFVLDFANRSMTIDATNNINFLQSTSRTASTTFSRYSDVTIRNYSGSNLSLAYPSSWQVLGALPTGIITNSTIFHLAAANKFGTSETNVFFDGLGNDTAYNILTSVAGLSNAVFGVMDYLDIEAGAMIPNDLTNYAATATNINFSDAASGIKQYALLFTDGQTNSAFFHFALGGGWALDTNTLKIKLEYAWQSTNNASALSNVFQIQVGATLPGEAVTNIAGTTLTTYPVGEVNKSYTAWRTAAVGPFHFGSTIATNSTLHFKVIGLRNDANDTATNNVLLLRAIIQYKKALRPPTPW